MSRLSERSQSEKAPPVGSQRSDILEKAKPRSQGKDQGSPGVGAGRGSRQSTGESKGSDASLRDTVMADPNPQKVRHQEAASCQLWGLGN